MAVAAVLAARARLAGVLGGEDESQVRDRISKSNLSVDQVHVCAHTMQHFLNLERDLKKALIKVPPFCVCLVCFIVALCEFSPPMSLHNVHRHLIAHYKLDTLRSIHEFHGIYTYMESFAHHNEEMQATSYKYWCENRYAVHQWDEDLHVPVHRCPSPRQYALTLTWDRRNSWSVLNGSASASSSSSSSTSSTASSSSSSSSGRRLAGSAAGSSSSGASGALQQVPPCEDNETKLRIAENDPNITCLQSAFDPTHMACDHKIGILFCPRTCGFCSPFYYDHLKKFEKPQVTMLPVMVHQTRFKRDSCHGFAKIYDEQPYNPVLSLLPALDGRRTASVLECFDRSQYHQEQYAFELECTADTPPANCVNGRVPITQQHTYHGDVVYPRLLVEPHNDVMAMKKMEWVDVQTEVVTVSTVIYTEDLEIFTSLSVDFKMDEAGNVDGEYTLVSCRDMLKSSKDTFLGCMIACSAVASIFFFVSCYIFIKYQAECKCGYQLFELISWGLFSIYPVILLVSWSQQIPMSTEYDHLLHTFLDMRRISARAMEETVQSYFDTKSHIYYEGAWLQRHRIVAYLILYIQFVQIVFYCNAHPRMAVLTETVSRAASSILHFLALFGILYFMLAFMAHWMLGPELPEFGTIGDTIKNLMRMTFGAFLHVDKVIELDDKMAVMYWLFAVTFMMVIWLTLLNFFLAIIVDAFNVTVKEDNADCVAKSFPADLLSLFRTWVLRASGGWPSRRALGEFFDGVIARSEAEAFAIKGQFRRASWMSDLEDKEERTAFCTIEELEQAFPGFDHFQVMRMLFYYYGRCEKVMHQPEKRQASKARAMAAAAAAYPEAPPGAPDPLCTTLRDTGFAETGDTPSVSTIYTDHPMQLPGGIADAEAEKSLGMQWC